MGGYFYLLQDSETTNVSLKTDSTSYKSPKTQLLGTKHGIIMGAPRPLPIKKVYNFEGDESITQY